MDTRLNIFVVDTKYLNPSSTNCWEHYYKMEIWRKNIQNLYIYYLRSGFLFDAVFT